MVKFQGVRSTISDLRGLVYEVSFRNGSVVALLLYSGGDAAEMRGSNPFSNTARKR